MAPSPPPILTTPAPTFSPHPHSRRVKHLPGPRPGTREKVTSQSQPWSCPRGDGRSRCRMEGAKAEQLPSYSPGPGDNQVRGSACLSLWLLWSQTSKTPRLLEGGSKHRGLGPRWGPAWAPPEGLLGDSAALGTRGQLAWHRHWLPGPEPQGLRSPKDVHTHRLVVMTLLAKGTGFYKHKSPWGRGG